MLENRIVIFDALGKMSRLLPPNELVYESISTLEDEIKNVSNIEMDMERRIKPE